MKLRIIIVNFLIIYSGTNLFSQTVFSRFTRVVDSISKKHPDSLTYRMDIRSAYGSETTFLYKKKTHWTGTYVAIHLKKLIVVSYHADSLVRKLEDLGLDQLKIVSDTELENYLNRDNPKTDTINRHLLPISLHNSTVTINVFGKKTIYGNIYVSNFSDI
jgi:hypothetical protein